MTQPFMQNKNPFRPHGSPNASTYLDFIQSKKGIRREDEGKTKPLFLAKDEKMIRIQDIIWQIADTNVPVLITGESGVGKEVIARAIHESGKNKSNPFVAINCAAMPSSLLESELFGFEKGAFTGAHQRHLGKFEQAKNGTLLLDEITEMDPSIQAKFLRVLQEKEIERIGGSGPVPINTRIVAATNRNIVEQVKKGLFRQDLYYRLYVLLIEVPPLRERVKDIEVLSNHFLEKFSDGLQKPELRLSASALEKLKSHNWPGNVRELQNILQRAAVMVQGQTIEAHHVQLSQEAEEISLDWINELPIGLPLKTLETHFILETLKHHQGNRTHAAKTLGISLRTLRNKINEYTQDGLEVMAPLSGRAALCQE